MREEHSAGAVVARTEPERRYLLLKYKGGHWGHVKGHVEEGEDLRETIEREAQEETGIDDLTFVDGFHETIEYTFKRGSETVHKRVDFHLTLTEQTEVEVAAPEEHTDVGWFSPDEARERITFEDALEVLEAAEAHLDQAKQSSLDRF